MELGVLIVAARDEGRVAAQRLVAEGRFPEAERARIVKNLTYYD